MKLTTKRKEQISSVLIICLGNILNAFSARVFLLPADLVAGGTTGIGLILLGILLLCTPSMLFTILPFVLGFWLLFRGFMAVGVASEMMGVGIHYLQF